MVAFHDEMAAMKMPLTFTQHNPFVSVESVIVEPMYPLWMNAMNVLTISGSLSHMATYAHAET